MMTNLSGATVSQTVKDCKAVMQNISICPIPAEQEGATALSDETLPSTLPEKIKAFFTLWTTKDVEAVLGLFSEDFTYEDNGMQLNIKDHMSLRSFVEQEFTTFPNSRRRIVSAYQDGTVSIVSWCCTASWDDGPFLGRNRVVRVNYKGVSVIRGNDTHIVSIEDFYDQTAARRYAFALTFKPYVEI